MSADTTKPRGRPPIAEHRDAVLDATRRLLARDGYDALTFEGVAQEADLYRRYVNRNWGSKLELVRDALFEDLPRVRVSDHGSLRADLHALVERLVELNERPEVLRGLPGLQAELVADPSQLPAAQDQLVTPPRDALQAIFGRARARGELAHAIDVDVVLATVTGVIQQLALRRLRAGDDLVDTVVELLLGGVVDAAAEPVQITSR